MPSGHAGGRENGKRERRPESGAERRTGGPRGTQRQRRFGETELVGAKKVRILMGAPGFEMVRAQ